MPRASPIRSRSQENCRKGEGLGDGVADKDASAKIGEALEPDDAFAGSEQGKGTLMIMSGGR